MAIVVPVFLLLIFGMVEFGRAVMMKQAVTDAARIACRKASLATTQSVDSAKTAAMSVIKTASTDTSGFVVDVQPSDLSGVERGDNISTSVTVRYSQISWLVPDFLGRVELRGESTMTRE